MAGNRLGKTYCAGMEVAMHMTGLYPAWWEGRRFDHPVTVWTGAETTELSRNVTQKVLLGTTETSPKASAFGTGTIPGDLIKKVQTRQAGVKDVADSILVKHVSGGTSIVYLKTYEQGRHTWQGSAVDVVWPDEEPPEDLYGEAVTRTMDTGGIVMMTFTPLKGHTKVVDLFVNPEPDAVGLRHVTNMTLYDAGHFTDEDREAIVATYPAYQRKTRVEGIPMAGEGMVFPVAEEEISARRFQIPDWWPRICGIDFGLDHPAAAVWLAHDRDTDTVYVTDCYKKAGETSVYHAAKINAAGKWIPVAWPHDGENRDSRSGGGAGKKLKDMYRDHGVRMLRRSARYDEETGGSQKIDPIVDSMLERMLTGRFKVFADLSDWFEEFRMYHRKDGKIVDVRDDIMAATRIAMIDLRKAKTQREVNAASRPHKPKYTRPIVGRLSA